MGTSSATRVVVFGVVLAGVSLLPAEIIAQLT